MVWFQTLCSRRLWLVVCAGLIGTGLALPHLTSAQTTKTREASKTKEAKLDTEALEKKVDEVLTNQKIILQKLDAMMEELRIIKVRSTR